MSFIRDFEVTPLPDVRPAYDASWDGLADVELRDGIRLAMNYTGHWGSHPGFGRRNGWPRRSPVRLPSRHLETVGLGDTCGCRGPEPRSIAFGSPIRVVPPLG